MNSPTFEQQEETTDEHSEVKTKTSIYLPPLQDRLDKHQSELPLLSSPNPHPPIVQTAPGVGWGWSESAELPDQMEVNKGVSLWSTFIWTLITLGIICQVIGAF